MRPPAWLIALDGQFAPRIDRGFVVNQKAYGQKAVRLSLTVLSSSRRNAIRRAQAMDSRHAAEDIKTKSPRREERSSWLPGGQGKTKPCDRLTRNRNGNAPAIMPGRGPRVAPKGNLRQTAQPKSNGERVRSSTLFNLQIRAECWMYLIPSDVLFFCKLVGEDQILL